MHVFGGLANGVASGRNERLRPYWTKSYGAGCRGTNNLTPTIGASGIPRLGTSFSVDVEDAHTMSPAALFLSATEADLPVGACRLLLGAGLFALPPTVTDTTGRATMNLPIPADPTIAGLQIYGQYIIVDPNGLLFGNLSMSDGIRVLIAF